MSYNSKYTGAEVEAFLDATNGKQDKIEDLDTIREGASKGATALQSVPSEYVTESELEGKGYLTDVPSEYVTVTELMWVKTEGEAGVRLKGTNGTATGNQAISAGDDKTASDGTAFTSAASGDHAVVFGFGNTCSGRSTLAQGLYNTVSGKDSVAFGQRNIVNGDQAFAAGQQNEVTTRLGVTLGYQNKSTNTNSIAIGYKNTSSGSGSVALGDTCESSGTSSTAMGYKTKASGAYASTFGENTQATNNGEVAMGVYNKSTTSTDASEQTLFSFGIGTSDTDRVNALEIKKNGDVYIGDTLLNEKVSVWDDKQDTITDLDAIRAGAAKGTTALQTYITNFYIDDIYNAKSSGVGIDDANKEDIIKAIKEDKKIVTYSHPDLYGYYFADVTLDGQELVITYPALNIIIDTFTTDPRIYSDDIILNDYVTAEGLSAVATTGSYEDLSDKPTIPAEQVNADWNATSGKAQILNKPTIPSAVTESTVSGWGFTKNTGTYSKPSGGIPKSDLDSATQQVLTTAIGDHQTIEDMRVDISDLMDEMSNTALTQQYGENKVAKDIDGFITRRQTVYALPDAADGEEDDVIATVNTLKTINGQSLIGEGDINISGSGGTSSGRKEVVWWDIENGETVTSMRPDVVYWFIGIDNVIIDSFEEPAAEVESYDVFTAILELGTSSASSISLTLPDYVLWANGAIPEIVADVQQYELSISRISDGWGSTYRAVLTPFKQVE